MLAFVLGGGGSRGALQVGALDVLAQEGIVPELVVGTSIGAVNGTMIALDPSPAGARQLMSASLELKDEDIIRRSVPAALWNMVRGNESLFSNQAWLTFLRAHLPDISFGDLKIPAYAVATNMDNGELRVFGDDPEDRLLDGLMASTALVPFYPAWIVGKTRYVDGATNAVLPLRQAVERGATRIIALNLTNQLMPRSGIETALDVMQHSVDIMLRRQVATEIELVRRMPHVQLKVLELRHEAYVGTLDTRRTPDLIVRGREIVREALPELRLMCETHERRFFPSLGRRRHIRHGRLSDLLPRGAFWRPPASGK